MKNKFFRSLCGIAILSTIISAILLSWIMYKQSLSLIIDNLTKETNLIAEAINNNGLDYIDNVNNIIDDKRLTIIDSTGQIISDSKISPQQMDNHLDRQEISLAFSQGYGQSIRQSDTINKQTVYYAVLLDNGMVLRLATTANNAWQTVFGIIPYAVFVCLIMFVIAVYIAKKQTESIVKPINAIDPEHPFSANKYEELIPFLSRLDKQNIIINSQMSELSRQKREFATISEKMNEGLIVVDATGMIITINNSARNIFSDSQTDISGKHIFMLNRSAQMQKILDNLIERKPSEETFSNNNNEIFQIFCTPIIENDVLFGGVLLIIDISKKAYAEQMRREFSANVSHELKTPLTAISGYAELIKDGIAKPEDHQKFAANIYNESARLLNLIDDILKLSALDEIDSNNFAMTKISLLNLLHEISQRLQPLAESNMVEIIVFGEDISINGNKQILDEMIYNLCENSIKYNKPNGTVTLSVFYHNNQAVLTVEDTGIGIPYEYRERVFERFYRVDKSRSKKIGGTGLGLSIVKHGATYHNAKIQLESQLDKGTKISITFPEQA